MAPKPHATNHTTAHPNVSSVGDILSFGCEQLVDTKTPTVMHIPTAHQRPIGLMPNGTTNQYHSQLNTHPSSTHKGKLNRQPTAPSVLLSSFTLHHSFHYSIRDNIPTLVPYVQLDQRYLPHRCSLRLDLPQPQFLHRHGLPRGRLLLDQPPFQYHVPRICLLIS